MAYNGRGEAYRVKGLLYSIYESNKTAAKEYYNLSVSDLDKAIQLDPNYSDAYRNRGITYGLLRNEEKNYLT